MRFYQGYSQGFSRGCSFGGLALTPCIKYMLLINAAVFIAQWIFPQITYLFGLTPARFFSDFPNLLYTPLT